MLKRYFNAAIIYAILAMVGGVFYREYTKYTQFQGATTLSFLHTHYFVLGMLFFLLLAILDKQFGFSSAKGVRGWLTVYHIGTEYHNHLPSAQEDSRRLAGGTGSLVRSTHSLSGVAGIGHALLGDGDTCAADSYKAKCGE